MQSILTIDQGNSRLKVSLYEDGQAVIRKNIDSLAENELKELTAGRHINGAVYSSVGKYANGVNEILSVTAEKVLSLTPATDLPIGIEYGTRATLGNDRIAAVAGAMAMYPGERLLVADAGTALTLDLAEPGRGFIGGNISPGIRMRLKALHAYTARLPEVSAEGDTPITGTDTSTALRSGAVRGAAAEIAVTAQQTGAERIIFTGGDGALLEKYVKEITGIRSEVVSDLVERGLLRIYEYNEDKL